MSLLFNMLSRLIIAFLPRSKRLLISWLQSAVILEPPKINSVTVSIVPPSICHEVMGPDAMILGFWMSNYKPVLLLKNQNAFVNKFCVCVCVLSHVWLCDTMSCNSPGSSVHGIHWSGLLLPTLEDLPDPGMEPMSLASCTGRQIVYHRTTWEAPL